MYSIISWHNHDIKITETETGVKMETGGEVKHYKLNRNDYTPNEWQAKIEECMTDISEQAEAWR